MELPTIDWHWLGTILGGGVVAAASRSLGIVQRMQALETRVDTQGQLMADQLDEITRLRRLVGEQANDLAALRRALAAARRQRIEDMQAKEELTARVAELEQQLAASDKRAVALAKELRDTLAAAQPSTKTMPPPGGRPR